MGWKHGGAHVVLGGYIDNARATPPRRKDRCPMLDVLGHLLAERTSRGERVLAQLDVVGDGVLEADRLSELFREGVRLGLKPMLIEQLLLKHEVHLTVGSVLLNLLLHLPRRRDWHREGAEPCERGTRATVRAADGGGAGDWQEGARANAPQ